MEFICEIFLLTRLHSHISFELLLLLLMLYGLISLRSPILITPFSYFFRTYAHQWRSSPKDQSEVPDCHQCSHSHHPGEDESLPEENLKSQFQKSQGSQDQEEE